MGLIGDSDIDFPALYQQAEELDIKDKYPEEDLEGMVVIDPQMDLFVA